MSEKVIDTSWKSATDAALGFRSRGLNYEGDLIEAIAVNRDQQSFLKDCAESNLRKRELALNAAEAKIALLRAALEPLVLRISEHDDMLFDEHDTTKIFIPLGDLRRARSALEETK